MLNLKSITVLHDSHNDEWVNIFYSDGGMKNVPSVDYYMKNYIIIDTVHK